MRWPWSRTTVEMDNQPIWLIVGLGNPERKYEVTRHNIGFVVVDALARHHQISITTIKHRSLVGTGVIAGQPVMLIKPQTYMNDSGRAVQSVVQFRKIAPDRIVVVSDDLDLPLGRVRVRPSGSSGGQKGLKSIMKELGTEGFGRVRLGIGRPERGGDVTAFVLQPFDGAEHDVIAPAVELAVDAIGRIVGQGYEQAMQVVNR